MLELAAHEHSLIERTQKFGVLRPSVHTGHPVLFQQDGYEPSLLSVFGGCVNNVSWFDIHNELWTSHELIIVGATNSDLLTGGTCVKVHHSDTAGGTIIVNITLRNGDGELRGIEVKGLTMTRDENFHPLDLLVSEEVNLLGEVETGIVESLGEVLLPVIMKGVGFSIVVVHVNA